MFNKANIMDYQGIKYIRLDQAEEIVKGNSKTIASQIIADLSSRRGIGDEWEQIDEEVQDEIFDTWNSIVKNNLTN